MFEAFREADYRRFWTTQFISNIGSWMQYIGQGWLVFHLTQSPFLLGFVGFANSIPSIVLMLPGGVLADRVDRKRVLRLSQWGQALSALFLAVMIELGQVTVWNIVGAAVVVGICVSFSSPAYQAMVVDLLDDRSRLPNAVAMNSLQFNLSRAIGPVIGGLALSRFGSFWCFFLNALSFLPLIWVLKRLKQRQTPSTDTSPMVDRLAEGFRYVRKDRIVALLLAIVAAASLFGYPFMTLMPLVAKHFYRNDAEGLGYLMGGVGIGSLSVALLLSIRMPAEKRILPIIIGTLLTFGIFLTLVPLAVTQFEVVILFLLAGASMIACVALCNTSLQQRIPDGMRGRILSMYTFAFYGFLPLGNLASGIVAERFGIGRTLVVLGSGLVLSAAVSALVAGYYRPGRSELA